MRYLLDFDFVLTAIIFIISQKIPKMRPVIQALYQILNPSITVISTCRWKAEIQIFRTTDNLYSLKNLLYYKFYFKN